ncbi:MAG TPA: ABC transporter ATP-binding protein [Burkholderiales bacterium]|nr:ABC transporter ATP-binding protein [Burkholderiales bacterium]
MTPSVVVADSLVKFYGKRLAVDRVSFDVRPNEVMGLLGPNGSGKSTILRILTGYLHPTSGTAKIGGWDVVASSREARGQLGYVPEDVPLYAGMRVAEFLEFMARVRGVQAPRLASAVDEAVERLSLGRVRTLLIAKLSRGYRQRVAIAQALLGRPKLLVLDEPTNGLDPRQIIEVRELIRALSRELSVLVTSHILAEIERVAHRAAILLDGKLLSIEPLGGGGRAARLRMHLRVAPDRGDAAQQVAAALRKAGAELVESRDDGAWLIDSAEGAAPAVQALVAAGIGVDEVTPAASGLEELFLRLTEGAHR